MALVYLEGQEIEDLKVLLGPRDAQVETDLLGQPDLVDQQEVQELLVFKAAPEEQVLYLSQRYTYYMQNLH